jgi:hypothetical protein
MHLKVQQCIEVFKQQILLMAVCCLRTPNDILSTRVSTPRSPTFWKSWRRSVSAHMRLLICHSLNMHIPSSGHVLLQALDPRRLENASGDAWELMSYRENQEVILRKGNDSVTCIPRLPDAVRSPDCPKSLAVTWFGQKLYSVSKHMEQYDFGWGEDCLHYGCAL